VEVDSPFYAPPSRHNSELWVERTSSDFTFQHDATLRSLADNGLTFVSLDEPQGFQSSFPPIAAARHEHRKLTGQKPMVQCARSIPALARGQSQGEMGNPSQVGWRRLRQPERW
jgi:hypothetical protein